MRVRDFKSPLALVALASCLVVPLTSAQEPADEATMEPWDPPRRLNCSGLMYLRPTDKSPYVGGVRNEDFPLVLGHVGLSIETWFSGAWRVYNPRSGRIGFVEKEADCPILDAYLVEVEDQKAEQERFHEAQARYDEQLLAGMPLVIHGAKAPNPDSAGGVDLYLGLTVLDPERTIKYLTAHVTPYNKVGEPVKCSIRGRSKVTAEITGPIKTAHQEAWRHFTDVWYHSPGISCVKIDRIEIDYMDGKREIYVKDLPQILGPWLRNDCSYEAQQDPYTWSESSAAAAVASRIEALPKERFVVEGDVIHDAGLAVQWSRSAPPVKGYEAERHCATLGEGWRLPSQREAEAIHFPTSARSDNDELALHESFGSKTRLRRYAAFEALDSCVWAVGSYNRLGAVKGYSGEFEAGDDGKCQAFCLNASPDP